MPRKPSGDRAMDSTERGNLFRQRERIRRAQLELAMAALGDILGSTTDEGTRSKVASVLSKMAKVELSPPQATPRKDKPVWSKSDIKSEEAAEPVVKAAPVPAPTRPLIGSPWKPGMSPMPLGRGSLPLIPRAVP